MTGSGGFLYTMVNVNQNMCLIKKKKILGIIWVLGSLIKLHKKKNKLQHEAIEILTLCQQKSFRNDELKD